jgi:aminoglycoside 3'-phosphotransferase-2
MAAPGPAPPPSWRDALAGYRWNRLTTGASGAEVFRLDAPGRPGLFVKTEREDSFAEGPGEAARLRWLAGRSIAAPRVIRAENHSDRHWLLMSAVPGRDAATAEITPVLTVAAVADALRALHAEPIGACPFDHTLEQRIARARARVAAGVIDVSGIDGAFAGRSAPDLLAELEATRPPSEDLVVAHGDACLENILVDESGAVTGIVDCSRLGVADRYQDLALASRSIGEILGEPWIVPFLARYGIAAVDRSRLRFYQLLDEFS